jgi:hypothetical protein
MIVTASDVASLSESLSRWEIGEYICAGLVTIACAGEYVAEFKDWFTGGIKERKGRLAKRSTLLLIVALSLELICLVRTNSISGMLIGSLSDKAEKADAKAQSAIGKSSLAENKANAATADSSVALSQAKDAIIKAGKAEESLGKAEGEANKAQTASSNALTLARGARLEADTFEKDITSAKVHIAEIREYISPRQVTKEQEAVLRRVLEPIKGHNVEVMYIGTDPGSQVFAGMLAEALTKSGINAPLTPWIGVSGYPNLHFQYGKNRRSDVELLAAALEEAGLASKPMEADVIPFDDVVKLIVSPKH